jgi:hypothetical protein
MSSDFPDDREKSIRLQQSTAGKEAPFRLQGSLARQMLESIVASRSLGGYRHEGKTTGRSFQETRVQQDATEQTLPEAYSEVATQESRLSRAQALSRAFPLNRNQGRGDTGFSDEAVNLCGEPKM